MNDVKNYLFEITKKLERVCANVLPDTVHIPDFSNRSFDNFDNALSGILLDFAIMEEDARKANIRYAVMAAVIKSRFVSDFFITAHIGSSFENLGDILNTITVDDMVDAVC